MPPVFIPPAGLTPAGLAVPQTFADPTAPPGILAPLRDPSTREYLSITLGMHPIDDQVITALRVKRASGVAVADDGNDFHELDTVTETSPTLIESIGRNALKRLTTQGDIAIRSIVGVADPDDDFGEAQVKFANLRARQNRERIASGGQ